MGDDEQLLLRGFDSYEVRLGDELRGERASKGKSLLDAQRDLRIKAAYLDAIENADASAFPFAGFAAGYVRAYARYLGLDPEDVYRRFCEESGFGGAGGDVSVEPTLGQSAPVDAAKTRLDDSFILNTSFAPMNARARRLDLGLAARGAASVVTLASLVVGVAYGGWTLLENVQRVGFAPLPTAPEVVLSSPDLRAPPAPARREASVERAGELALDAVYAPQELPAPSRAPRDGPIAAIDPREAGVYAALVRAPERGTRRDSAPTATPAPISPDDMAPDRRLLAAVAAKAAAPEAPALPPGVSVFATAEAWVRIRDADSETLFTGILDSGDGFELPGGAEGAELRAGNAHAVYLIVDGAPYGPLGQGGAIAKNVSLTAEDIRARWPEATDVALIRRAEEFVMTAEAAATE